MDANSALSATALPSIISLVRGSHSCDSSSSSEMCSLANRRREEDGDEDDDDEEIFIQLPSAESSLLPVTLCSTSGKGVPSTAAQSFIEWIISAVR